MPRATSSSRFTCTLAEVREVIGHHLEQLWAHPEDAAWVPPVMLWGPPGVGKSQTLRELCREKGVDFVDVRLAQMEPVDLRGLPVPKDDVVRWLPSAHWPRDAESRGIILFDELTAADRTLQVAAYELILDRCLGDLYRVPPGWYIVAAGNRTTDRAVAMPLSAALANRFCHLEVEPDLPGWLEWAAAQGLHESVRAFVRFLPDAFFSMSGDLERGFPTPRSWERVARALKGRAGLSSSAFQALVIGLVGEGVGFEFLAFLEQIDTLPAAEDVLSGKAALVVPEGVGERYAVCAALARHLWEAADRPRALGFFLDALQRMPADLAMMAFFDALAGRSRDQVTSLLQHERCQAWAAEHLGALPDRYHPEADALAREVMAELEGLPR